MSRGNDRKWKRKEREGVKGKVKEVAHFSISYVPALRFTRLNGLLLTRKKGFAYRRHLGDEGTMNNPNTGSLRRFMLKALLLSILPICLILVSATGFSAQTSKKKIGYKGPIDKEQIISTLTRGEIVEGYVVRGDDLIEIIRETDLDILVKNSIIEGGLDFSKLPEDDLTEEKLPTNWKDKEKEAFIKVAYPFVGYEVLKKQKSEFPFVRRLHNVSNRIVISDSEIRGENYSINASRTFFWRKLEVVRSEITGIAAFATAVFNDVASFQNTRFGSDACFMDCVFINKALFYDTTFYSEVSFPNSSFNSEAAFHRAVFENKPNFNGVTFLGEAFFPDASFHRMASFWGATFNSDAYFNGTDFRDTARFKKATFRGRAVFSGSIFNRVALFKDARFLALSLFQFTKFKEIADFRSTIIEKLNWNNAEMPCVIEGRVDFRDATISEAHFQDTYFRRGVDFSDSKFGKPINASKAEGGSNPKNNNFEGINAVVFRFIGFEDDTYFLRTQFHGNVAFERINFKKNADFTDAVFQEPVIDSERRLCLSYLRFQSLLIRWNQLPPVENWITDSKNRIRSSMEESKSEVEEGLQPLSNVLQHFEDHFRRNGRLNDANQAYYHRRLAKLRELRNSVDIWNRASEELLYYLGNGLSCYFTKLRWILLLWIVSNPFFVLIYSLNGDLRRLPKHQIKKIFKLVPLTIPQDFLINEEAHEVKIDYRKRLIRALRLSTTLLWKIGPTDTVISGKYYRLVVWFEWFWGYYLLVLFVITLAKVWPPLNWFINIIL